MRPFLCIVWFTLIAAAPLSAQTVEAVPGYYHHSVANKAYRDGFFAEALTQFEISARWGDKLSQYNLGTMHYQGRGTPVDKPRAWAWLGLAAERRYPQFERAASLVWAELDESQRIEAERIYETLRAEFGDAVAVPRAQARLDRERRKATGSRTGFIGALQVYDMRTGQSYSGDTYYDPKRFDFSRLVEQEAIVMDALDTGRVELRELKIQEDE